jgi:hypothetical protein
VTPGTDRTNCDPTGCHGGHYRRERGPSDVAALAGPGGRADDGAGAAAQAAFQSVNMQVASSKGTRWSGAELRQWEGDSGTLRTFTWSA